MVGYSGGKDSEVTLKLIVDSGAFTRVEGFYMYLVPGLRTFEGRIDVAEKRYGVKIHRVPHWDLARMLSDAVHRPAVARGVRKRRLKDVELYLTRTHGIEWFAYGERGDDNYARRLYTRKVDGVHPDWKRLWPIWDWPSRAVVQYLKHHRIPLPARAGKGSGDQAGSSGFGLTKDCLTWLKRVAPDDYAKVLERFPYAEAQIVFEEQRGKVSAYEGEKKIRRGDRAQKGPNEQAE